MGDEEERRCGGASDERPCEPMDDAIIEHLRHYIANNYATFAASDLTFRHLKEHLAKTIEGIEYADLALGTGKFGDTLDDEVDAIAVRCDGGSYNPACVFLPDYAPPVDYVAKYGTHLACGGAGVVLVALAALACRRWKKKKDPAKAKRR